MKSIKSAIFDALGRNVSRGGVAPQTTSKIDSPERRSAILQGVAVIGGGIATSVGLTGCGGTEDSASGATDSKATVAANSIESSSFAIDSSSVGSTPLAQGKIPAITATGSYVGNGTAQQVWVGFRPDFVLVCPLIGKAVTYVTPTTWNGRTSYFAESTYGGGPTKPRGVTLYESGFAVGSLADVNQSGATYVWFAYKDNDSDSLFDGDYRGSPSYMSPRTIELFAGKSIRAAILKRDNTPAAAHMYINAGAADYKGNAVSAVLNADGTFTVGNEPIVNTGESCNVLAFPDRKSVV